MRCMLLGLNAMCAHASKKPWYVVWIAVKGTLNLPIRFSRATSKLPQSNFKLWHCTKLCCRPTWHAQDTNLVALLSSIVGQATGKVTDCRYTVSCNRYCQTLCRTHQGRVGCAHQDQHLALAKVCAYAYICMLYRPKPGPCSPNKTSFVVPAHPLICQ
jgi:hypothetical protein